MSLMLLLIFSDQHEQTFTGNRTKNEKRRANFLFFVKADEWKLEKESSVKYS